MRVGVALTTIRFHSLAPMYYRGAQAAIVVYDITMPVCGHIKSSRLRARV